MPEIKVAVVGCGFVANDHLKAWKKLKTARVVAVSDLNEALAKSTAATWKIPSYYLSLSKLIESSNIDLVDICTPPQTHAALAVQAMKAGLNVLIEKPMTMTVEDAERIAECQKTTRVKAGVIHNWLFEPCVLKAVSIAKKGYLGELLSAEIEALSPPTDSMAANERHWSHHLAGGRFSEMLAHPIYLIDAFLGECEVCDVQTAKIGRYPWMKYDELSASFKSGEKIGRTYASFNAPRDAIFISLYGREALLKLDIINSTINLLPRRKTTRFSKGIDSFRQATQMTSSTFRNVAAIASGRWLSGHDMCIKLFAESILHDVEPPVTIENGLKVVRTLEKICKLIETR